MLIIFLFLKKYLLLGKKVNKIKKKLLASVAKWIQIFEIYSNFFLAIRKNPKLILKTINIKCIQIILVDYFLLLTLFFDEISKVLNAFLNSLLFCLYT